VLKSDGQRELYIAWDSEKTIDESEGNEVPAQSLCRNFGEPNVLDFPGSVIKISQYSVLLTRWKKTDLTNSAIAPIVTSIGTFSSAR
jgi:hypothetical protein